MHILCRHFGFLLSFGFLSGSQLLVLQIIMDLSVKVALQSNLPVAFLSDRRIVEKLVVISIIRTRFYPLHGRHRLAARWFKLLFITADGIGILILFTLLCFFLLARRISSITSCLIANSFLRLIIFIIDLFVQNLSCILICHLLFELLPELLLLQLAHSSRVNIAQE